MSVMVEVRGDMLIAAVNALLWSETTGEGEPLDTLYAKEHISHETIIELTEDVVNFVDLIVDLEDEALSDRLWAILKNDPARAGVDFILSRNGHGTGFWDRGYGADGDELHKWAKTFGEFSLYVGDDGYLYN